MTPVLVCGFFFLCVCVFSQACCNPLQKHIRLRHYCALVLQCFTQTDIFWAYGNLI